MFSTVFKTKFFLQNVALLMLEAALLRRKLSSHLFLFDFFDFLSFQFTCVSDTDPNPEPDPDCGSVKAKSFGSGSTPFHCKSLRLIFLSFFKTYEGDVQDLGLDFTVAVEEFGETRVGETEFQIFVYVLLIDLGSTRLLIF